MEKINSQDSKTPTETFRPKCDKKYRKRVIIYLLIIALACIIAFIAGVLMNPFALQKIWLVFFGTLIVLSGIVIYILMTQNSLNL